MIENLASDTIAILRFLLPGFVAAWLFYGLTSHPKPTQFERVVQALILTFVITAFLPIARWFLVMAGNVYAFRPWDESAETFTSLLLAIAIGALLAVLTNNDFFHRWLRKWRLTSRTSHPSEWFYVLSEKKTYVTLQFKDGRRLHGWPKEWPVDPNNGQFYIQDAAWQKDKETLIELPQLDGILVKVEDIHWVEFVHPLQGELNE